MPDQPHPYHYSEEPRSDSFNGDHTGLTAHFPYAEVFARMDGPSLDCELDSAPSADGAEALAHLLRWFWSAEGDDWHRVKSACVKFVALTASLRPDLTRNMNFRDLGICLGVSRQRLSKASLEFSDLYGIKWGRSWSKTQRDEQRRKMREL
jgi:hypothetical protein